MSEGNKRNGEYTLLHDNGIVKEQGVYVNDLLHGERREYYKDGSLASSRNYSNGVLDGKSVTYHEGKNLVKDEYFCVNGKIHGVFRSYDKNGQSTLHREYFHGEAKGISIGLENGVIWIIIDYDPNMKAEYHEKLHHHIRGTVKYYSRDTH